MTPGERLPVYSALRRVSDLRATHPELDDKTVWISSQTDRYIADPTPDELLAFEQSLAPGDRVARFEPERKDTPAETPARNTLGVLDLH